MRKEFEIYFFFSPAINTFFLMGHDAFFQSIPLLLLAGKQYTILRR